MRSTTEIPLVLRAENAIVSYVRYLRQLLWPTDLALFLSARSAAAAIRNRGNFSARRHFNGSAVFWTQVPLSDHRLGLVRCHALAGDRPGAGRRASAGRPLYLSAANRDYRGDLDDGDAIAWRRSFALRRWRGHWNRGRARVVRLTKQTRYWRNSESIWLHTLAVTKNNDVAHNELGEVRLRNGPVEDAIQEFQTV